ncbi:aminoacyl-tRNA deacylase [Streptococcus panodentis]|uniref:Cys-tRNA(Pro)/Cys-tRNA(Cys) deacylase n=1 Tax=Streptococcus panodentis TaxID=1581472 RepID=A0ABS5AV28_9STRE|nr:MULTISPECIES: aminoacyl-tRNA deacylase [Streptococcus]KXT84341.1 Transcriptional regulator [Streptococcus sp. DD11]MBP2620428.1 aminoacyl-tRNA deacylase [Streptococcus panodentis]
MAKKTKMKKTLVEQILTKAEIPHQGLQLNALEDQELPACNRSKIYKTLALKGDKTGTVIGILPITEHLSEKKLAKISGNKKVSMIPQKDLEKTTGYIHGANNPVGIRQKHSFPIYIDQQALTEDRIIVSAGEVGRSIAIQAQELADFVQASFADLKEERQESPISY